MNLSLKAARFVIAALDHYQKYYDEQLQDAGLPEDDVSDLVNDRQYVEAIKKDFQEYHEALLRKRGPVQTGRDSDALEGDLPFSVSKDGV